MLYLLGCVEFALIVLYAFFDCVVVWFGLSLVVHCVCRGVYLFVWVWRLFTCCFGALVVVWLVGCECVF